VVDAEVVGRHLESVGFKNVNAGELSLATTPCIAIVATRGPRAAG
jgi:hypothetical protein